MASVCRVANACSSGLSVAAQELAGDLPPLPAPYKLARAFAATGFVCEGGAIFAIAITYPAKRRWGLELLGGGKVLHPARGRSRILRYGPRRLDTDV